MSDDCARPENCCGDPEICNPAPAALEPKLPEWPRTKHGHTQAIAVCEARGATYVRHGFDPHDPTEIAEMAAHDLRARNWHESEAGHVYGVDILAMSVSAGGVAINAGLFFADPNAWSIGGAVFCALLFVFNIVMVVSR